MVTGETAAQRWADDLAAWTIPDEILAAAPESPWGFPPGMFAASARRQASGEVSRLAAKEGLGAGGTVLDVGCGGGAAAMALVPPATEVIGVDQSPDMLALFAAAAEDLGVPHREVAGTWPDASGEAGGADVVVCHHVAYNVAPIRPFVEALAACACRRVVVELTERHPSTALTPLWERFWGLARPQGPSAEMFVEVVGEAGFRPLVSRRSRAAAMGADQPDYVAFVRRRLCLPAERDAEVAAALAEIREPRTTGVATVWWDPHTGP